MAITPTEYLDINDPGLPSFLGFFSYEVYSGDTLTEAKAFLSCITIHEPRYYVIVETPDGVAGRDADGIYEPSRGWRGNDLDEPGRVARFTVEEVIQAQPERFSRYWPNCPSASKPPTQINPLESACTTPNQSPPTKQKSGCASLFLIGATLLTVGAACAAYASRL